MTRAILISIHPEHVDAILSGQKRYELRRIVPNYNVSHLIIYATSPIMKVMAIAEVIDCIKGSPTYVWNITKGDSNVSRVFYRQYFHGRKIAYAFLLGHVFPMTKPIILADLLLSPIPPQSFRGISATEFSAIMKSCGGA